MGKEPSVAVLSHYIVAQIQYNHNMVCLKQKTEFFRYKYNSPGILLAVFHFERPAP